MNELGFGFVSRSFASNVFLLLRVSLYPLLAHEPSGHYVKGGARGGAAALCR